LANKGALYFYNKTGDKLTFILNGWTAFKEVFLPFVDNYPLYGLFGDTVNYLRNNSKWAHPKD
jgi:hypothetical protein